jgi:uncharacterized protein HemX
LSAAVAVLALLGAGVSVVRHSLTVQRVALEKLALLEGRIVRLELKAIDRKELDEALEKALARLLQQIERRIDGVERGLRENTDEMHQMRTSMAVLNALEGVTDYTEHNRKVMEAARRG